MQFCGLSVGFAYQDGHCELPVLNSQVLSGARADFFKKRFKVRICNTTRLYRA